MVSLSSLLAISSCLSYSYFPQPWTNLVSRKSVIANWFRRLFGRPEHPPAVSGEHSVLFILQSIRLAATLGRALPV